MGIFLWLLLGCVPSYASQSLGFLKSQNFLLSSAIDGRDWLLPFSATEGEAPRYRLSILGSLQPQDVGLYHDLSGKNEAAITHRLEQSYGTIYDAVAKVGIGARIGDFEQTFSMDAAASLRANDPVFPDLEGILYNDYALGSSYRFDWDGIRIVPGLTYGLRRVMEQSLTIGQLLDTKPNTELGHYPYRFFADLSLAVARDFAWGELAVDLRGVPLWSSAYLYWQAEISARSHSLLGDSPVSWQWWASLIPLRGGDYSFGEGIKIGTSLAWTRFLQADLFLIDKFRPGAILRLGPTRWNAQLFTFSRADDQFGLFTERQYGLSLNAGF